MVKGKKETFEEARGCRTCKLRPMHGNSWTQWCIACLTLVIYRDWLPWLSCNPDKRQKRQKGKQPQGSASDNGTVAAVEPPGPAVVLFAGSTTEAPAVDAATTSNVEAWQHGRLLQVGQDCYQVDMLVGSVCVGGDSCAARGWSMVTWPHVTWSEMILYTLGGFLPCALRQARGASMLHRHAICCKARAVMMVVCGSD